MRTKLFRSFLLIILIALLSSLVFQRLIVRDFDLYVESVREDQLGWVVASVESSYVHGQWDLKILNESLHWAMMLGIDAGVFDSEGREILNSRSAIQSLEEPMANHMASLFRLDTQDGSFATRPLNAGERRVGELLYRPFLKRELKEREKTFKEKTRYFLYVSLATAGVSGLFVALLLTRYLSRPLLRMKEAAHRIAQGDYGARIRFEEPRALPKRFMMGHEPDETVSVAESFNFMAESLQREEALRRDLFSNISHELRTPLTIMKAHLEALEDGILEDPQSTAGTIKMEAEKLIELVRGIEDLTLAQAAFTKPGEPAPIHLGEFLAGLLHELSPLLEEKNLTAELVRDAELGVSVDVDKLEKIVRNLLSNAIKFTRAGGSIRIHYGREEEAFFFDVRDTGMGISESHLPHIFDRFYRAEKSDSSGLGLGLAITKELVEALGGRIDVESEVGKGTAFRVRLPLHPKCS